MRLRADSVFATCEGIIKGDVKMKANKRNNTCALTKWHEVQISLCKLDVW